MLKELVLRLAEYYHKANINTTIGSSVPSLAKDMELVLSIMASSGERVNGCPYRWAVTEVERRKEKYGRRLLNCLREQGREPEGIDYLKRHFPIHLDNIVQGEPIP